MAGPEMLNIGIVGACGRGASFRTACEAAPGVRIHAVCDVNTEDLADAAERLGAAEQYTDYEEMLDKSKLQAVVIGTPMHLHVPQSIAALERGLHVLCEVPAGVSIDECRQLVTAAEASDAVYMMAENYCYAKPIVLIKELCRQGLFGEVYYAEGEYLHELKELNETTRWRRKWQTGIAGITYGTHSLGPILQWMPGDRVVKVCCANSGSHHADPRGEPYAQDTATMLCKTARGALIQIRVDMISDRPHAMHSHHLQGTDGVFESSRGGPVDRGRIWLRTLSEEIRWHDLESLMAVDALAEKYLPEMWRNPPAEALTAGHGGGDFWTNLTFANAIRSGKQPFLDVYRGVAMSSVGILAWKSALADGEPIE
ncbi:hypothetical protein LCGC14_2573610, partial [marine sediment metagenome]